MRRDDVLAVTEKSVSTYITMAAKAARVLWRPSIKTAKKQNYKVHSAFEAIADILKFQSSNISGSRFWNRQSNFGTCGATKAFFIPKL